MSPPQTPSSTRLDVEGGSLEFVDYAGSQQEPPLVVLHEGLGSIGLLRSFPADLAGRTGRRVVAYSRQGYGHSSQAAGRRGLDYLHREAALLPAVLAGLDCQRPVIVGHSDGASIALIAAGEGLVDAAGLVVMAPHVMVEQVALDGITAAGAAFRDGDLRARLARHHDHVDWVFQSWHDTWLSPAFRPWDITDLLAGVTAPVLAIQGVDDRYGTMRQLDLIETGVSGPFARVELSDCDHSPHLEQPERTLDAVAAFVAGLG